MSGRRHESEADYTARFLSEHLRWSGRQEPKPGSVDSSYWNDLYDAAVAEGKRRESSIWDQRYRHAVEDGMRARAAAGVPQIR